MAIAASGPEGPILVIEDEDDMRTLFVGLLSAEGYAAIGASDGAAALRILREQDVRPCLIVLDLVMPGMDGWEFRALQRRDPRLASVPVVVVSGYGDMLSDDDLGAIDVFTKPVDLDALLGLVARTCTRRSSC